MFTSRAEHRLLLRIDNADLRLTPKGREAGLVDDERWDVFEHRRARLTRNLRLLDEATVRMADGGRAPASQLLRQPGQSVETLREAGVALETDVRTDGVDRATLETTVKYGGYLRRQERDVEKARRDERCRIPADFVFRGVPGLTHEVVQRLEQVRPETLGHAQRVPGITPAAVAVLAAYIRRFRPASSATPA